MSINRIILFFIFMALFMISFQLGTFTYISEKEAEDFMTEFDKLVNDIDGFKIFVHNTAIALPMIIPGFGIAWGLYSAWATGVAFAAIVVTSPSFLMDIQPLTIFLTPFGMMEIAAYSIGLSRSFILIRAIIKKTNLRIMAKPIIIEAIIMVSLLLAGGFIEIYMIESITPEIMDDFSDM